MNQITSCHILYYWYPYNEYLRWDNWNTMYDFTYANQDGTRGRTHLHTSMKTIQNFIKCKVGLCEEITWFYNKTMVGTKRVSLK